MAENRYFWLRLHTDFFDSKRIKKLRRLAGGATYCLIYLKLLLLAIKTDGILTFTHLEDSFADELALDIDESPDDVAVTVSYLLKCGLAESNVADELFLPWAITNTGSEGSSAKRMRELRAREKEKTALPEKETSHCDAIPSQCAHNVTESRDKIDKEINNNYYSKPQSVDEVKNYLMQIRCTDVVDAEAFYNVNEACGWINGNGKPIANWKKYLYGVIKEGGGKYGPQSIHGKTTAEGTSKFDGLQIYDVE